MDVECSLLAIECLKNEYNVNHPVLFFEYRQPDPALRAVSAVVSGLQTITCQSYNDHGTGDHSGSQQHDLHGIKLADGNLPYIGKGKDPLLSIGQFSGQTEILNTGMEQSSAAM